MFAFLLNTMLGPCYVRIFPRGVRNTVSSGTHLSSSTLLIFSTLILPDKILGKFVTTAGDVSEIAIP